MVAEDLDNFDAQIPKHEMKKHEICKFKFLIKIMFKMHQNIK